MILLKNAVTNIPQLTNGCTKTSFITSLDWIGLCKLCHIFYFALQKGNEYCVNSMYLELLVGHVIFSQSNLDNFF